MVKTPIAKSSFRVNEEILGCAPPHVLLLSPTNMLSLNVYISKLSQPRALQSTQNLKSFGEDK